jgi:hypothetical protein
VLLIVTILLVLAGIVLLALGLVQDRSSLIYVSMACAVVAGLVLFVFHRLTRRALGVSGAGADGGGARSDRGAAEPEASRAAEGTAAREPAGAPAEQHAVIGSKPPASSPAALDDLPAESVPTTDAVATPVGREAGGGLAKSGDAAGAAGAAGAGDTGGAEGGPGKAGDAGGAPGRGAAGEAGDAGGAGAKAGDDLFDDDAGFGDEGSAATSAASAASASAAHPEAAPASAASSAAPPAPTQSGATSEERGGDRWDGGWDGDDEFVFPIEEYDDLRVTEILPILDELEPDELVDVRDRERAGKSRGTILRRIEALLSGEAPGAEAVGAGGSGGAGADTGAGAAGADATGAVSAAAPTAGGPGEALGAPVTERGGVADAPRTGVPEEPAEAPAQTGAPAAQSDAPAQSDVSAHSEAVTERAEASRTEAPVAQSGAPAAQSDASAERHDAPAEQSETVAHTGGGRGGNPIADYESLRVAEILPRLAELDPAGLAVVEAAERTGANRTTVLNRILRLRDAAGLNRPLPEGEDEGTPRPTRSFRTASRIDPAHRAAAARRAAAAGRNGPDRAPAAGARPDPGAPPPGSNPPEQAPPAPPSPRPDPDAPQ